MGMRATVAIGMALAGVLMAGGVQAATTVNVSLIGEGSGAMSIKVDQAQIPAGEVTFNVENTALTEEHEMVVVRVASAKAELPYDATKQRVIEGKVKSMGEVSDLKAGSTGKLTTTLKPGTYRLICNVKGHYMAGMSATVTVTAK
jgi:uncharacterized cupredoxin-like copper-binding protein